MCGRIGSWERFVAHARHGVSPAKREGVAFERGGRKRRGGCPARTAHGQLAQPVLRRPAEKLVERDSVAADEELALGSELAIEGFHPGQRFALASGFHFQRGPRLTTKSTSAPRSLQYSTWMPVPMALLTR